MSTMEMDRRHRTSSTALRSPFSGVDGRVSSRRSQAGFTMAELVIVMVISGILAAYALPKISSVLSIRDDTWRNEIVTALRYAQKSAVARRRLMCVNFTTTTVTITAAVANPAVACTVAVSGPDNNTIFATAGNTSANTAVAPAGTLYFQPDGRVTSDGAGATASTRTISMLNVPNLTVYGETGHVE
jgi:prepilin-type N-terminal cleavage/methylation domain-containing protein